MKEIRTVTECEYCGTEVDLSSPPQNSAYEGGRIEIKEGLVLLPHEIVKNNSHAKYIDGYYCNLHCLSEYIKSILVKK